MIAALLRAEDSLVLETKSVSRGERKLDALTALRFFAASMIFLGHATALAPPNRPNYTTGLALWQGVSFFFVLSGFILAYVYPQIKTPAEAGRFLLARFARIWPTHLVAFMATIILVPQCMHIPNALSAALINLCMVQVWTLDPVLAASFNKVSWTISVELFFYVFFPFLIKDYLQPFKARWIIAGALSLSFVFLCMVPFLPGGAALIVPEPVFIGFNPLCRLLEFITGIAICRVFTKGTGFARLPELPATGLEILSLGLVAASICLPTLWPAAHVAGPAFVIRSWLLDMGGAPAYAALIFLMANERGHVSKFLTGKFFVWLGEISFSLYMFHLSIIFALIKFQPSFANQPDWVFPSIAFLLCICVSHLNYKLIETPCRKAIMGMVSPNREKVMRFSVEERSKLRNFKFALPTVLQICCALALVAWVNFQFRFIPLALAERVEAHSVPTMRGVRFGDKFKLRGLKITHQAGGIQINSVWESLLPQRLSFVNVVQMLDAKGTVLSSHDYLQDTFHRDAKAGQIWEDKIFLNHDQIKGATRIGLELYDQSQELAERKPLISNSTNSDWERRRLLLSLE